jgi:putative hydrolase of the HAD superfamily
VGGLTDRKAVLLDALGTLLALEPPAPALREQLAARCGIEVELSVAEAALVTEIAYYREHHLEGGDPRGLSALRRRCAAVLRDALGPPARDAGPAQILEALLASLRFVAFPDVAPALARMRAAGVRLVVVSNWDVSLHDRLAEAGIAALVDGAVTSAEVGAAKPDPTVFSRGLELAGVEPAQALHAGDSPREDLEGARAAGIDAVLVAREAPVPGPGYVRSLAEVADLVA